MSLRPIYPPLGRDCLGEPKVNAPIVSSVSDHVSVPRLGPVNEKPLLAINRLMMFGARMYTGGSEFVTRSSVCSGFDTFRGSLVISTRIQLTMKRGAAGIETRSAPCFVSASQWPKVL